MSVSSEAEMISQFAEDLSGLGVRKGTIILVHSSFKALREAVNDLDTITKGLLTAVGEAGTLLMPALSYMQEPPEFHSTLDTPSCVGAIPEYFRKRAGTLRSVHPTHSICGIGPAVQLLFKEHHLDTTPCGEHSPLNKMIGLGAKIVMLGCGLRPNTTMHALEEYVPPPYLFGDECVYTIKDARGVSRKKKYRKHGFNGWTQRYDRIELLPGYEKAVACGTVLSAETYVIDTSWLKDAVLAKLREEPLFFVDKNASSR